METRTRTNERRERREIEIWKFNRQVQTVTGGTLLRIHSTDTPSNATGVGIDYVDIPLPVEQGSVKFTFLWLEEERWEGRDYLVEVQASAIKRGKVAHGKGVSTVA